MNQENNYAKLYKNKAEGIPVALYSFCIMYIPCRLNPAPDQPHSLLKDESGS